MASQPKQGHRFSAHCNEQFLTVEFYGASRTHRRMSSCLRHSLCHTPARTRQWHGRSYASSRAEWDFKCTFSTQCWSDMSHCLRDWLSAVDVLQLRQLSGTAKYYSTNLRGQKVPKGHTNIYLASIIQKWSVPAILSCTCGYPATTVPRLVM